MATTLPPWDQRVERVVSTYRQVHARTVEKYGRHTRAAYLVTFITTLAMFDTYLEAKSAGESARGLEAVTASLDELRLELSEEFKIMMAPIRLGRSVETRAVRGVPTTLFRYDGEIEEMEQGRRAVKDSVSQLRNGSGLRPAAGIYMYCLSGDGELCLYSRPMAYNDMLTGLRHGEIIVKHPMLVDERAAVLAAGEIYISYAAENGIRPAGVFLTSASGHYQPLPSSEQTACGAAMATLNLPDDSVWSLTAGRHVP